MAKQEIEVNDQNFKSELSTGVALVDFWAAWCGPCRMQGPIIGKVAEKMAGQAKVAKCDVDTSPKSSEEFKVYSIPTIVILKDGKEVARFVGVTEEEELVAALKNAA